MATTAAELKVLREAEWRRCRDSFPHFFANYWVVILPDKGVTPVEARELQLECAKSFQGERRMMILKARQIGWTTLICAYTFWKAWYKDHQHCLVLSRREDPEAVLIVQNIKFGYKNLPAWMRARGPQPLNDRKGNITYDNGSYIDSDASSDDPARGRTLALLVLDEFGKFENPTEAWSSATPATEYGQCIVLGNANGYGTWYHTLCLQSKAGDNDFSYRFYPWWAVPGRTQEWLDKETSSYTPSQRAAEFPDNDVDCWVSSGSPVFDSKLIGTWPTDEGHRSSDHRGVTRTWGEPREGYRYVIGADVAGGGPRGDFSVAQVIEVQTGKHVAEFRGQLDPPAYAHLLHEMALKYNRATISVEANNVGQPVLKELLEEIKYFRLYRRRTWNRQVDKTLDKYGFETNRASKQIAISDLWKHIIGGRVKTTDGHLFEEMIAYRYLNEFEMGGLPHDDRVMSMAIAIQLMLEESQYVPTTQEAPAKPLSRFPGHDGTLGGMAFQAGAKSPTEAQQKMRDYYESRPAVMNGTRRRRGR